MKLLAKGINCSIFFSVIPEPITTFSGLITELSTKLLILVRSASSPVCEPLKINLSAPARSNVSWTAEAVGIFAKG